MRNLLICLVLLCTYSHTVNAASLIGRLGIGMSNQVANGMQAISMKLQRSRSSALGGIFGLDSSSDGVQYALGIKGYKYIYEEPQLNFYSALTANTFTYKNASDVNEQGYQIDGTFGTEFTFQGLESIGFSFEFGVGFSKNQGETHLKTIGYNMIASAVHFYL